MPRGSPLSRLGFIMTAEPIRRLSPIWARVMLSLICLFIGIVPLTIPLTISHEYSYVRPVHLGIWTLLGLLPWLAGRRLGPIGSLFLWAGRIAAIVLILAVLLAAIGMLKQ